MKRKRLAFLLAVAMTVASFDSTAIAASGADFGADVEVSESDEEVQTESDEEIALEPEEVDTSETSDAAVDFQEELEPSDTSVDFQDGSVTAGASETKEVADVSLDLTDQRTTFISNIESCYLADAKMKVTYTDGTSETLKCGWRNNIEDSYGNNFTYTLVPEDGNGGWSAGYMLEAGRYKAVVKNYEDGTIYNSYWITVEDNPDLNLFPRIHTGETNDLSYLTEMMKYQNWFVFTADADSEYETARYDFNLQMSTGEVELRPVDDRTTRVTKEEIGQKGSNCFVLEQGKSYYVKIRIFFPDVASINMPVKKYADLVVPDAGKITELSSGSRHTVDIEKENDEVWFSFTPAESGKYKFYSAGENSLEEGFFFDSRKYYGTTAYYRENDEYGHYARGYTDRDGNITGFEFLQYLDAGHTYYFCARLADPEATGSFKVNFEKCLTVKKIEATLNRHKIEVGSNSPLSATLKYTLSDGSVETRHLYAGSRTIFNDVVLEGQETQTIVTMSGYTAELDYARNPIFGNTHKGEKYMVIFRYDGVESEPQEIEIVDPDEADCFKGEVHIGENPGTVSPEYEYSIYKFVPSETKRYIFSGYKGMSIACQSDIGLWYNVKSGDEFEKGKPYYIRLSGKVDDSELCNLKIEERRSVTGISFVPDRTKVYTDMQTEEQIVGKLTLQYDDGNVVKDIDITGAGYTDSFGNQIRPVVMNEAGNIVDVSSSRLDTEGTYKVCMAYEEVQSEEYLLTVKPINDVELTYSESWVVLKAETDDLRKEARLPGKLNIRYSGQEEQVTPFLGKDVVDQFGNTIHTEIYYDDSHFTKKFIFTKADDRLPAGKYKIDFTYTDKETGRTFLSVWSMLEVVGQSAEPCANGHAYSGWKVTSESTAVSEGTKERSCTVCGKKETAKIAKLTPTVKLNVTIGKTLPLKVKQSFQAKASGLAKGDRVVSWKSGSTRIATVNNSGKIVGKKAGTATITVKLASGKSVWFKVKVQKSAVATTSLKVVNKATGKTIKSATLKAKKRLTLSATIAPVTSKQKVTYSSSNKKIATVSSKGVITAKKKGKATITVKSGKKSVKIKITVK